MKKEDFIINFIYCTIMVAYLFIVVYFQLPVEALYLLFAFLAFVPLQIFLKKFFVAKKSVTYNSLLVDKNFLERPFKTTNPYIHTLKKRCQLLYIPSKFGFVIAMVLFIITQYISSVILCTIGLILLFSIPIWAKKFKATYEELENLYKTEIELMFSEYLPNMHYNAFDGIKEEDYRFANFNEFDLFESEDYVYGEIEKRNFVISEVSTYIRQEDEHGKVSYVLDFQGTCGIINVIPPINSFIYLVTPGFGLDIHGLKITTDNNKFNDNYDIFTGSEFLATMLLTPSYMQKLLDFRDKFGVYVELKVHYDVIFFRFHTGNLFAPSVFGKNEDKEFAMYFQMIYEIHELMEQTVKILDKLNSYN